MAIHPTAMVDPTAMVADDAQIGPYAYIGPQVEIGAGCLIQHHAHIDKLTTLGAGSQVWPYAAVGGDPQDLKYQGEPTRLLVGKSCRIREFVTVNRGTVQDKGYSQLGDNCLLMAYSHVAHDCILGDHVILANCGTLAGHVVMEDHSFLGGLSAVHQFTRIGAYCYVGGMSAVAKDLPPFTVCEGNRAKPRGLNLVGLKRNGFDDQAIEALKKAYQFFFRSRTPLQQLLDQARGELPDTPQVRHLIDFIAASQRGVAR